MYSLSFNLQRELIIQLRMDRALNLKRRNAGLPLSVLDDLCPEKNTRIEHRAENCISVGHCISGYNGMMRLNESLLSQIKAEEKFKCLFYRIAAVITQDVLKRDKKKTPNKVYTHILSMAVKT